MTHLAIALALLMTLLLPSATLAQSPEDRDELDELLGFGTATEALLEGSAAAGESPTDVEVAIDRALVTRQLNLAKAEQRALGRRYRAARREVGQEDRACQLALLEARYQSERARLQERIVGLRAQLGYRDRRSFLTKAGGFLGAIVKEAVEASAPELVITAITGGLGDGVARKIVKDRLVRVGRKRGQELLATAILGGQGATTDFSAARVAEACAASAAAAEASATPSPDEPMIPFPTGRVVIDEVIDGPFGAYSAGMIWDTFLGQACTPFQAYNPSFSDPSLPGIRVHLTIDFDDRTFKGSIRGPAHGSEFGWAADGRFTMYVPRGTLTEGWRGSFDLQGQGVVLMGMHMKGRCAGKDGPVKASNAGSTSARPVISGTVSAWELDLRAQGSRGDQSFILQLSELELQ